MYKQTPTYQLHLTGVHAAEPAVILQGGDERQVVPEIESIWLSLYSNTAAGLSKPVVTIVTHNK